MVIKTKLTEMLGIEHPIVQGGMHFVGYAELAAAVSEAGGLGIITALTQPTPEKLREEIQKCRRLTSKPFGVNMTLLPTIIPPDYGSYIKVILEEGIKIVETAGRSPEKIIHVLKENGVTVIHKCTTVRHALSAQRVGADVISIDGLECGGHPGENGVGNWILLDRAAKELTIPVIVSGGCATGTQLAAALCMGAHGMNMGTRFMATVEAPIHQNIKEAIVNATEYDTMLILNTINNTERVFKNKAALEVAEMEKKHPGNLDKIIPLIKGNLYREVFQETGEVDKGVWSCGQTIGLINNIPTVKDLIKTIVADAEEALGRARLMAKL